VLASGSCVSESAEAETEAAPAELKSAPGVETSYWFPKYGASLAFPAGDVVSSSQASGLWDELNAQGPVQHAVFILLVAKF
jgi:hypothetical protein